MTQENFKKALDAVMRTDEIDFCIKWARGKEKRWLKQFKKEYVPGTDYPFISLINVIKSPLLWSEIVLLIVSFDEDNKVNE